ncbi:ACD_01940 [African swine fever virus]
MDWSGHRMTYAYVAFSLMAIAIIWYILLIYCRSKKNVVTSGNTLALAPISHM